MIGSGFDLQRRKFHISLPQLGLLQHRSSRVGCALSAVAVPSRPSARGHEGLGYYKGGRYTYSRHLALRQTFSFGRCTQASPLLSICDFLELFEIIENKKIMGLLKFSTLQLMRCMLTIFIYNKLFVGICG